MDKETFLFQAVVYLAAAIIGVNLAKRLGLGTILGYLIAGIVIGPFVLGFVGQEGENLMHVAEFGVVMMLFVIGLELEPTLLWRMRKRIIGLGGLQILISTAAIGSMAFALGQSWQASFAIGSILSLSSTAIVMQTLSEKSLLKTKAGKSAFAVLLSQDIAVIPLLALIPLLATQAAPINPSESFISNLNGWQQTITVLGAIGLIIIAGRYLVGPLFRWVAKTRQWELFMATALLMVFAIAELMVIVGLSPALGTFLAGVVLANSEYRHELQSDIDPFKGLLLGLFFMVVGATINFDIIKSNPLTILTMVVGLMLLKGIILFQLSKLFRLKGDQTMIFAVSLAQMGEFAFVLFAFAGQHALIDPQTINLLIAVVAISMALTPLIFVFTERQILPRYFTKEIERVTDDIQEEQPVIIAGFGRYGNIVGRFLKANGVPTTILDNDSDRVDLLRKFGYKVYYGDASRFDLMKAAGAEKARIIIIAMDTPQQCLEMVALVKKYFPHLKILSRAYDHNDSFDLMEAGVDHVYRETLDSSIRLGADALKMLGFRSYQAQKAAKVFLRHDEKSMIELMKHRKNINLHMEVSKEQITELEAMILRDMKDEIILDMDSAGDRETLTKGAKQN